MSRASEVRRGCAELESGSGTLVVACHCGDECPNVPTDEGLRILRNARDYLEGLEGVEHTYPKDLLDAEKLIEWLISMGPCPSCDECAEFSSYRCEVCSGLPGERHAIALVFPPTNFNPSPEHGIGDSGEIDPVHYSACVDCLMYVANGELPEGEVEA